jgi:hypothetical protein
MNREIAKVYGVGTMELNKVKAKKACSEFKRLHPELVKGNDAVEKTMDAYYRKVFRNDDCVARYGIVCELLAERLEMEGHDIRIYTDGESVILGIPPMYPWATPPEATVLSESKVRRAFHHVFVAIGGGIPVVEYLELELPE